MTIVPINEIRKLYPNPTNRRFKPGDYCTGAAFCRAHGYSTSFPTTESLSVMFEEILGLGENTAFRLAAQVIRDNDEGRFEEAWNRLAKAIGEQS